VLFSLTVIDAAGWKISGASVTIDDLSTSTRTDIDGKAQVWLVPGSYSISVNAVGFLSRTTHIHLKGEVDDRIELTVAGTCSPCLSIDEPAASLDTTQAVVDALLPYEPAVQYGDPLPLIHARSKRGQTFKAFE